MSLIDHWIAGLQGTTGITGVSWLLCPPHAPCQAPAHEMISFPPASTALAAQRPAITAALCCTAQTRALLPENVVGYNTCTHLSELQLTEWRQLNKPLA